ncbi:hypothetical protein ACHAXT_012587 [Thalassiosira profunda]
MDSIHWGSLVAQVEEQLHAMSPDDFRAGARQLQMLAHAEAAKRGEHAPNLVAAGQPIVQQYDGAEVLQLSASVSFSPVKSSRAGAAAATPAWQHLHPSMAPPLPPGVSMHPSMQQPLGFMASPPRAFHPTHSVQGHGLHISFPVGVSSMQSSMPSPASYLVSGTQPTPVSYHPSAVVYTPTRTSVQSQGLQTGAPRHPFDSFTLDLGAATPILHRQQVASSPEAHQPSVIETVQRITKTASKWSNINVSDSSMQGKAEKTEPARPRRKRRQGDVVAANEGVSQPSKRTKTKAKLGRKPIKKRGVKIKIGSSEAASETPKPAAKTKAKTAPKAKKPATRDASKKGELGFSNLDVLCGRGGMANRHEGNARFRDEAKRMRPAYHCVVSSGQNRSADRERKFFLSLELVERVHKYGGRFLKKGSDGLWYEIEDEEARKKASQALRETKKW